MNFTTILYKKENRSNIRRQERYEWVVEKAHNKKYDILYRSLNIVRIIKSRSRWAGHVARMKEGRSVFKILTGKPTGKGSLGRPRRRWEDNIRMDLTEIGINTRNWVDSTLDRNYWRSHMNAVLNLRVQSAIELIS